ncbi:MAG: copper chaperone PCu(A)C [Dehalococcoidia bacterium]
MNPFTSRSVTCRRLLGACAVGLGLLAVACGAPQAKPAATPSATATATPTASPTAAGPQITLTDVWARATPGLPDENSAIYATVQNKGAKAERIVSASVPETITKRVELHTMVKDGDMMKMQQVDGLDVPASGTLKLAPGGFHIMLIGLAKQLKVGDTFTVTLKLASGATVESKVEVRAAPAATPMSGGAMPSGTPGAMPAGSATAMPMR